ncbi:uncharacterized protein B0I36DRAFT_363654 [Microdochium trichocladiopsis]|uniref:Exonuclease 1 n=1 Tax=Microdochium trichocladiopsis TaxID=1682393 RepID=A0A9P8Y459_9PEZI|nr:uncharacterized protein B0I36DRAFT_363654 [Microdochium trichocladiopsis]KAH7029059.1 hypothetical protein B0I36DRAFT_363654 [Microdochium trichocladiopsis]
MGIQGLLPLLKSIHRPVELSKYAGETLAVDAYGWLHRGAIACAIELAEGKPTRKYVDFAMHRVRMCLHFGVTPYLVFDGDYLPSKRSTEESRAKRRDDTKKAGLELLKAGKRSQAHLELQKAIDITPEMARHLIEELKKAGTPYVVAPYEADAQMVYLEKHGHVSGILSEDSDLLVFGAKKLLTKLDQYGHCVEINRKDFCAVREVSLTGWTDKEFRLMTILSGCDYLAGVNNLGLKTAHRMIRKYKTAERVIKMLQFDGKVRLPADYSTQFRQAEQTFLYQWAFCPAKKQLVNLNEPPAGLDVTELPFIGQSVDAEVACGVANGDLNPMTKDAIIIPALPEIRKRTASGTARVAGATKPAAAAPKKPIDTYFQGHRRIPLGEMEPNCFSIDPNRVADMTENGNRPIVFPLPRPYIEDSAESQSAPSRTYISRPTRANPRRVSEPVSNLLVAGGQALGSSRRQTAGPELRARPNRLSIDSTSLPGRPPKKARLCDDAGAELPVQQKSKFFAKKQSVTATVPKDQGYLMSDDSIEDALSQLPDLDGWESRSKSRPSLQVFEEPTPAKSNTVENAASEESVEDDSTQPSSAPASQPVFSQPSRFDRFQYDGSARRTTTSRRASIISTPGSFASSTPGSSFDQSSSVPASAATACTTPGTPHLTPLQRLGAQALNRPKRLAASPMVSPPRRDKRASKPPRRSLEALPVNAAFIPLPPVDVEEVEALHKPTGSEDLLGPESENEEHDINSENIKPTERRSASRGLDLSRFLCA